MANDIFSTLRTYLGKVTDGDKNASEVASTVNHGCVKVAKRSKSKLKMK